jgi:hypothetical protein
MMANSVAKVFGHSSSSNCHTYLDIYYQNVHGLRTKTSELLTNIHSSDFPVICLTEIWLNDFCFNQNLFPETYLVYRADRVSATKSHGRGTLIATSNSSSGVVRRADLELVEECVCLNIPTTDGYNLLIGNHYFPPDTSVDTIKQYFCSLDTYNFQVLVGDFNVPGFDWKLGLSSSSSYYYIKLKGEAIYTSTCLLSLSQHNYSSNNGNLLDLIFSNVADFSVNYGVHSLVHPDVYHPPFVTELKLPTRRSNMLSGISFRKYSSGDYLMLYDTLSTYDWSSVYNETSVDAAVDRLTVAVTHAIAMSVPTGCTNRCKFPVWFSSELKSYIRKKNYFYRRCKKYKSNYFYDKFSSYRGLVKATIRSDKLQWLKSIDNNLKNNPVHFWKYVSSFRKSDRNSVDLEVFGNHLSQPHDIAEAFAEYFKGVFNNPYLRDSSTASQSPDSLYLASVSDSDILEAIKRL